MPVFTQIYGLAESFSIFASDITFTKYATEKRNRINEPNDAVTLGYSNKLWIKTTLIIQYVTKAEIVTIIHAGFKNPFKI